MLMPSWVTCTVKKFGRALSMRRRTRPLNGECSILNVPGVRLIGSLAILILLSTCVSVPTGSISYEAEDEFCRLGFMTYPPALDETVASQIDQFNALYVALCEDRDL